MSETTKRNAERYLCLRAMLRHARWNDIDAIAEMKPEFEKYICDNDLDAALDAVIDAGEKRSATGAAAEREVGNV